jgi:hypothetical protein
MVPKNCCRIVQTEDKPAFAANASIRTQETTSRTISHLLHRRRRLDNVLPFTSDGRMQCSHKTPGRGRQIQPTHVPPSLPSSGATACWTGRRSSLGSPAKSPHVCPRSAFFSGPPERCSKPVLQPLPSMTGHHLSLRTRADLVAYSPQPIRHLAIAHLPAHDHDSVAPRSAARRKRRPSRHLSNDLPFSGGAQPRPLQRLAGQRPRP